MTIKTLLAPNKTAIWVALLWTGFIVFMCLKPTGGEQYISFPNADKVAHFTFYFGFIILWYRYFVYKKNSFFNNNVSLIIISIVFGILIEFAQKIFTTSRQADIWDVVANSSGSLIGFFVAKLFYK